jgi:pimeloyl-ACP methyl ester carboxylesterase
VKVFARPSFPRLSHQTIQLADGHRVGVTIGGEGIPLVILHGIALNTRVYTRFLSRLSTYGYRVIAIDAAAHGRTAPLPDRDFRSTVNLLTRTLDTLGVRRAVVVGHSMGGRATIELAAAHPERILAAVLLDAAAGDEFDESARKSLQSLPSLATGLIGAFIDTAVDWWHCTNWRERRLYGLSLASALTQWGGHPHLLSAAMNAVAQSTSTGQLLRRIRTHYVPVIVVHAEHDMLVPWPNAVNMAKHAGGVLHMVPDAYHSWLIANPQRGADLLGGLLATDLREVIGTARHAGRTGTATSSDALFAPGALALTLGVGVEAG